MARGREGLYCQTDSVGVDILGGGGGCTVDSCRGFRGLTEEV